MGGKYVQYTLGEIDRKFIEIGVKVGETELNSFFFSNWVNPIKIN